MLYKLLNQHLNIDSVKQTIANLEQQIKELQQHVLELVDINDEISQILELLLSMLVKPVLFISWVKF